MGWASFYEVCAAAGGAVRLTDAARAAGLHPQTVRRRAAAEGWWRPHPDVVAPPGTHIDARTRALAAVRHLERRSGDEGLGVAAATRWTAAHLLGVRRSAPSRPQVLVDHRRRITVHDGLEVVRGRGLSVAHVRSVAGVPTVSGLRLLRDLAAVCRRDPLRAVAIDLAHGGELDLAELAAAVDAWPRFHGRPLLRQVLADLTGAGRTDSPLELEARERLAGDGIPLDQGQVRVPLTGGGVLHLDLGIAAIRFGIEVDSYAFHSHRTDVTRDARRDNAVAGTDEVWRVLRLTWDILREDWPAFVMQSRDVIAVQSRHYLGVPWPRPGDVSS